jgi:hypothetical protein
LIWWLSVLAEAAGLATCAENCNKNRSRNWSSVYWIFLETTIRRPSLSIVESLTYVLHGYDL